MLIRACKQNRCVGLFFVRELRDPLKGVMEICSRGKPPPSVQPGSVMQREIASSLPLDGAIIKCSPPR